MANLVVEIPPDSGRWIVLESLEDKIRYYGTLTCSHLDAAIAASTATEANLQTLIHDMDDLIDGMKKTNTSVTT